MLKFLKALTLGLDRNLCVLGNLTESAHCRLKNLYPKLEIGSLELYTDTFQSDNLEKSHFPIDI